MPECQASEMGAGREAVARPATCADNVPPLCARAGMPYPQNLQTALEVEAEVRAQGAVPATIAIIAGQPCVGTQTQPRQPSQTSAPVLRRPGGKRRGPCLCVRAGLTDTQLEHIARQGTKVSKVSRRDLAAIMASKRDGATTVSATMLLAALAGIRVFVTGGIGGVHRCV